MRSATSPNLKMFDWMYIAVFRQESSWYLLVGQNNQYYLSNASADNYSVKGTGNLKLVESNVDGLQYYIRDIFVSSGREYDKDSIKITPNRFWNHGCDSFVSVAHEFAVSTTPAESQFYFPLDSANNLNDTLGGLKMLYSTGTSGNYSRMM